MNGKNIVTLGILAINCWGDIKKREIYLLPTILYGLLGLGIHIFTLTANYKGIISSLIPGIFLLLVGKASNGKVGYGDGILVLALGLWVGFLKCLLTLTAGLTLAAIWSGLFLIIKRYKKNDEIPFIPFLLLGYLLRMLL